MHLEAVSDGEKFQVEGLQGESREQEPEPEPKPEPVPEPDPQSSSPPKPDPPPPAKPGTPEPSSSTRKRRSRSRSRSRGSKDLKGKIKPPRSPPPASASASAILTNDSSPDDSPPSSSPPPPPILAPTPSHLGVPSPSRMLMSPNFLSSTSPLIYSGTSSPAPVLPSLDAIQRGLVRSNSMSARMQALQKLTGSADALDSTPSGSPQPAFGKLARNNTVSGGERSAARIKLFTALHERIREADTEGTSGGEDRERVPPVSPKRRRRRSARHSGGASNRVATTDESSEVLSTSTSTPVPLPVPLPFASPDEQPVPEPVLTPSATPVPAQPLTINLNDTIAGSRGTTPVRTEPPSQRKRRSILVEPDDDIERVLPQRAYPALPVPPVPPSPRDSPWLPHSSDTPSLAPVDPATGAVSVPIYLSLTQRAPSRQDHFPSSPFATPHKEISLSSREEEGNESEDPDKVVYTAENLRRSPYHDAFNRQISWVADPGQCDLASFA